MQLNGAVLMGVIPPNQASLMQRNLKTVLDVQLKRSSQGASGPSPEALIDICRRDPQALNAVEAFLTHDQLAALMAEMSDESDEAV